MIPLPNDIDSAITPGTNWIEFLIQGHSPELLEQAQRDCNESNVFTTADMRMAAMAKLREYEKICDKYFSVLEYLWAACKMNCSSYRPYRRHAPNCPVEDLGL